MGVRLVKKNEMKKYKKIVNLKKKDYFILLSVYK